jgi:perosamine synthetase
MDRLAILGGKRVIDPSDARFVWPRITPAVESAVLSQLKESISIYDSSGIFGQFEKRFSDYYGIKHALLSNSGTSAIFSMFEGIKIRPGDEVICPSYTFFATVSPLIYLGGIPVFCDCREDGNIDPKEVINKISSKTKAVIVTHMWGIPCGMDEIVAICRENNLLLLEDCSHAHGASFEGKKVGSFGDAAAWSLQGQKIVSGGEGGIMLTNNPEIFYRALLQGHYNKRCKKEIPSNHSLYPFALTGFGLKLRAHPLAIAIANEQFVHLDEWINQKQAYVSMLEAELGKYSFLKMPQYSNSRPSWYAFVMQFVEDYANEVSIDNFVKALLAEGLVEVDRPGSTRPIHDLPLFTKPSCITSRFGRNGVDCMERFNEAEKFYANAIKLPVWAFSDEKWIVERYIEGFHKVCNAITSTPNVFQKV